MDRLIVTIKNPDHPHYPKSGYVEVKNGTVHVELVGGLDMFTINFDDGLRGMATYSDCKLIRRVNIEAEQFTRLTSCAVDKGGVGSTPEVEPSK